jgi:hypothetical protein
VLQDVVLVAVPDAELDRVHSDDREAVQWSVATPAFVRDFLCT